MLDSEKLLYVTTVAMAGETVNLYVTSERFVGIFQAAPSSSGKDTGMLVGALGGGIIGGGIGAAVGAIFDAKKKKKTDVANTENHSLDDLTKLDKTDCFEVLFSNVKWIKIVKSRLGNSLAVESTTEKGAFQISKEQTEKLSVLLPSIDALKGKLG